MVEMEMRRSDSCEAGIAEASMADTAGGMTATEAAIAVPVYVFTAAAGDIVDVAL